MDLASVSDDLRRRILLTQAIALQGVVAVCDYSLTLRNLTH